MENHEPPAAPRSASAAVPPTVAAQVQLGARAASAAALSIDADVPSSPADATATPPSSLRASTPTTPANTQNAPRTPSSRRHRKALSASVAGGGGDTPRHRRTLSAVDEDRNSNADEARDPHSALEDLRSLRSSGRRRMRALRDLECALAAACTGDIEDMEAYVSLQAHTPLLALLGRHTASLAKRASTSSLPAGDELARHLAPEIDTALGILQGLTLLSRACKAAVGERWTMEMFLDLLLLLRTQPPEGSARPTVYALLDLLFCVLVDSPQHARMFEDLQGLEAVTRVLRGTGVAKDVRMKCCEFLYFYLLPEGSTTMPEAYNLPGLPGSRSTSASSIGSAVGETSAALTSQDVTQSVLPSPSHSRVSSLEQPRPASPERWNELSDLPFIPETPRKPKQPSLGFQTPSANRRTSGSSSVSVLTPVAQSPDDRKSRRHEDHHDAGSRTSSGSSSASSSGSAVPKFKIEASSSSTPPSASRERGDGGLPGQREVSTGLARRSSKRVAGKSPLSQPSHPSSSTPDSAPRRHSRSQSASTSTPTSALPTPARGHQRSRSRGFPSELTRGVLPSSSGAVPLTPSRRLPTEQRERTDSRASSKGAEGSIRSVAEKKEMLGQWLGNVDQLVQGVEKVGFWAKKENAP